MIWSGCSIEGSLRSPGATSFCWLSKLALNVLCATCSLWDCVVCVYENVLWVKKETKLKARPTIASRWYPPFSFSCCLAMAKASCLLQKRTSLSPIWVSAVVSFSFLNWWSTGVYAVVGQQSIALAYLLIPVNMASHLAWWLPSCVFSAIFSFSCSKPSQFSDTWISSVQILLTSAKLAWLSLLLALRSPSKTLLLDPQPPFFWIF